MKMTNNSGRMDPARVALFFGLSVGLGIVLHESFFVVASAIAVGAIAATIANTIYDHTKHSGLTHEHR